MLKTKFLLTKIWGHDVVFETYDPVFMVCEQFDVISSIVAVCKQ